VQLGATNGSPYWGIPATPSMSVTVTAGAILTDRVHGPGPDALSGGDRENPYAPCSCGSGLKFRYCCRGLQANF